MKVKHFQTFRKITAIVSVLLAVTAS